VREREPKLPNFSLLAGVARPRDHCGSDDRFTIFWADRKLFPHLAGSVNVQRKSNHFQVLGLLFETWKQGTRIEQNQAGSDGTVRKSSAGADRSRPFSAGPNAGLRAW
jgi:hypothetical protein